MRRVRAGLVALLMGSALAVAVGSPAQAWSYCNPVSGTSNALNMWPRQGYCYAADRVYYTASFDYCLGITGTSTDDWAGALWNKSNFKVTVFQGSNCSYAYAWMDLPANTSDPDLVGNGLHHNISSFKFWP